MASPFIQKLHATCSDVFDALEKANIFCAKMPTIEIAHSIAQSAHERQKRDNGDDYLEGHIYPMVLEYIRMIASQNETFIPNRQHADVICIIMLHDSLEDNQNHRNNNNLIKQFSHRTVECIRTLTKNSWKIEKGDTEEEKKKRRDKKYLKQLILSPYPEVCLVKSIDLIENVSCSLKYFPHSFKTRIYINKVLRFSKVIEKSGYGVEAMRILRDMDENP